MFLFIYKKKYIILNYLYVWFLVFVQALNFLLQCYKAKLADNQIQLTELATYGEQTPALGRHIILLLGKENTLKL